MENLSQNYGASPAIWDYPTQMNVTRLTLSHRPTGRYSIYSPQRDERMSWCWC